MPVKFPCKICKKPVAQNHKAVCCDVCDTWVHMKCNKINTQTYNILKKDEASWSCIECSKNVFPFSKLNETNFLTTIAGKKLKFITTRKKHNTQEDILVDRLNEALNTTNMENSSSYYNFDQFNEMFDTNVFNGFNTLHLNISSLPYNFDQLETLLTTLKVKFDILGITESRLKTGKQPINNIDLKGYVVESTPTDASCGNALLYINRSINYKLRKDLKIHKSKEVESIFTEIINKKERNTIIGCIYRHPCMDAREFNDTFLQNTLEKLSYENKDIILMGDCNIDILKYDTNNDSAAFLDMMYENFLLPYISSPTKVTPRSQSLIDNIFSNIIEDEIISGNITTTISDHYAQFTLFKNKTKSLKNRKIAKFARNYKTLDKEMFDSDLKNTNWNEILKMERGDVDYSFEIFNKKLNEILDKHAPFTKLSIQEEKLSKKTLDHYWNT